MMHPSLRPLARAGLGSLAALTACGPRSPAVVPAPPTPAAAPVVAAPVPTETGRAATVVFADGWRLRQPARTAFSARGMVVSNAPLASEAGAEILRLGGNAVDAAVATGFALAVVWPEAGNLGGGGYSIIQYADGRRAALDYREQAPQAASRDMYLKADGTASDESIVGWRASGVPGAVAGLLGAHARYGKLPRAVVMGPALRMARDGFVVDSGLFSSIQRSQGLIARYAGRYTFLTRDSAPAIGSTLVQPALARTLAALIERGEEAFYTGWIADSVAAEMARNGGVITKADLARYRAAWRQPLVSTYRDWTLVGMPPSSSGGTTMAETLNMLENEPALPAFGSTSYLHLLGSAFQRAFVDRNSKLGDPDFVRVPLAELTSKAYARTLWQTIDRTKATPTTQLPGMTGEGVHTTHYSVVDGDGNAVATTTTLNNSWGSGVYLASVGFMMNDEMDDFAVQPGKPNMFGLVQGEANAIAPGKRMLSAMSPTVVLDRSGAVRMVAGAAGGPRIITATAQVILNVIEHRMTLADAMRAPRAHHQSLPDVLRVEEGGFPAPVLDSLRAMGHKVETTRGLANVNAIVRVPGGWQGVHEPRAWGAAVGPTP
ncbi:MAG: gamma-glutamyltransferase [Gemmatimonadaceae bacterium]|jgi:gamma-glutamyltranspeptidase/glutathione hydrolase|nr:gamma-glutamyltransferase [Gemmatimonadaceae bacterium]